MKKLIATIITLAFTVTVNAIGEKIKIWEGRQIPSNISAKEDSIRDIKGRTYTINSLKEAFLKDYSIKEGTPKGAVIVCPGGGYKEIWIEYEGTWIAQALNKNGIAAFVLAYRVPNNHNGALMDAQRAIKYLRANAKKFNINPDKIAIMGFSAGGSLSARASTSPDIYKPEDSIDKESSKPNATGLIYAAYSNRPYFEKSFYGKETPDFESYDKKYELAPNLKITKDTPPAFILSTQEDHCVDSAIAHYLAMKKVGASACLNLFHKGKHGFSIHPTKKLVKDWFDMYVKWLKHNGF